MVTTNEAEAESELERRREHGTETGGTGARREIVRTWVSGVGPLGNQGGGNDNSGQAEARAQAIQLKIRDLQSKNDSMKTRMETQAIREYLTSVGNETVKAAVLSGAIRGEAGTEIGAVLGFGVGGPPLGGVGAAGGAIVAGVGALSYTGVTESIKLQETLKTIRSNWEANFISVQNYSNINCNGVPPEIRC